MPRTRRTIHLLIGKTYGFDSLDEPSRTIVGLAERGEVIVYTVGPPPVGQVTGAARLRCPKEGSLKRCYRPTFLRWLTSLSEPRPPACKAT